MNLKRIILSVCTAILVASAASAQRVVLESQPLDKALTAISIKTGAKVYWKPADVQNITIKRTEGDADKLADLFGDMLSGTGLKATFSADGKSVFIAKGNFLVSDVAALSQTSAIANGKESELLHDTPIEEN